MDIDFLNKQGFKEVGNIEELKTSVGKVVFDKDGRTSRLSEPDLRYFWDGERFGLHVSDGRNTLFDSLLFEYDKFKFYDNCEVLYLSRNNITNFEIPTESFKKLKYLNLSNNEELINVSLNSFTNLFELYLNGCPLLKQLKFQGNFPNLKKLEIIKSGLIIFYIEKCKNLEYLNISNNLIKEVSLLGLNKLKYFFGCGNPINFIKWPIELKNISVFQIDGSEGFGDDLNVILELSDNELQTRLNAYLKQLNLKGSTFRIGCKLIFIGNTTAGKSTLRRIFLSEEGDEFTAAKEIEYSTHGVKIFTKSIKLETTEIEIQGFDFGGQDYYHATHLPFISHNALNILVYGFIGKIEDYKPESAYSFGIKEVEDKEEIIYPINYWIGSLKKNKVLELQNEDELGSFLEHRIHEDEKYELDGFKIFENKEKREVYLKETNLELIQNLHENGKYQELNNLEIKQKSYVSVGDIVSFNFHQNPIKVKEWLIEKIQNHSVTRPFLYTDNALIEWFKEQSEVIFEISDLYLKIVDLGFYINEQELIQALKRIHSHNFGFLFEFERNEKSPFYINKLEKFSEWIHSSILTKNLINEDSGYFTLEKLNLESEALEHQDKIIGFLEANNVIFKVRNEQKWVAPAYLPNQQTQAEKLLLESFENPECIFEFEGFFHSNIILMIIDKFEANLVLDPKEKQYIIWKNKVILHQKTDKSKAYLLIELKYPGDSDFKNKLPQLAISRNSSGFVKDSIFEIVFDFVKKQLENFTPKISIKTRFGSYIPFECLFQKNNIDGKERSNLIFHDQTIYSIYDFRHFWKGKQTEPTKIFIGYSKFDIEYVEEFILHLKPYENQGDIVLFYDKDLKMGDKWDEELKHQLTHSDLLVCIVTPNMLNTKYVVDLEIPLAHQEKVEIVPIILEDCNWAYQKLNNGLNLLVENNAYCKAEVLPAEKHSRQKNWKDIAEKLANKTSKTNGTNPPSSITSSDDSETGHHQTNGGK